MSDDQKNEKPEVVSAAEAEAAIAAELRALRRAEAREGDEPGDPLAALMAALRPQKHRAKIYELRPADLEVVDLLKLRSKKYPDEARTHLSCIPKQDSEGKPCGCCVSYGILSLEGAEEMVAAYSHPLAQMTFEIVSIGQQEDTGDGPFKG